MGTRVLDPVNIRARILLGGCDAGTTDELLAVASVAGYCVVGKAEAQRDIVEIAINLVCDVIVVDVSSWTDADVMAIGEEVKITLGLPLLILCEHLDRETYRQAKAAGIDGVLVKPVTPAQLGASIEFVIGAYGNNTGRSGTYAVMPVSGAMDSDGVGELSTREREVFALLARGYRTSEIGRELFISAHTVRKHAKLIFRKLGVHSQIELMRRHFARIGPR